MARIGFVGLGVLALTVEGVLGALIVMLSHGIPTDAMVLLVAMFYGCRHTRRIGDFGGLAAVMPRFATAFMATALASIGLPRTSGFVAEFLARLGTFEAHLWITAPATTGAIFAAKYTLPTVQRMRFGPATRSSKWGDSVASPPSGQ